MPWGAMLAAFNRENGDIQNDGKTYLWL
jgi:hypothetical protein